MQVNPSCLLVILYNEKSCVPDFGCGVELGIYTPPPPHPTACAAGEYSVQGESCQSCPANSNSGTVAPECPCNEGYYRAASEGPETDCTRKPVREQIWSCCSIEGLEPLFICCSTTTLTSSLTQCSHVILPDVNLDLVISRLRNVV